MNDILQQYLNTVIKRYDDDGITKYYHYTEFDGLNARQYVLSDKHNNRIVCYLYSYPNGDKQPLIVFSHGMGGGHRSYMREIERICKEGYRVFAYDCTGCFESDGESILGITQGVYVLNVCLDWLHHQPEFNELPICLIGHSWGAYCVCAALNTHEYISRCVGISCFASIRDFLAGNLQITNKDDSDSILDYERRLHAELADTDLVQVLQNTCVPTLLLHAQDDFIIPPQYGLQKIQNETDNPRLQFIWVNNKKHLPHYTREGVDLLYSVFADYTAKIQSGELSTTQQKKAYMQKVDFYKMTGQDEDVWQRIFLYLQ